MPSQVPLVSIIITSYNYAAYLARAIDGALAQTYPCVEVIVVDDGSSDGSKDIISYYGGRILSRFKANGGQASAWNAGFELSHGEVICFLDSDDILLPTAMQNAVCSFNATEVLKVHWPLLEIDEHDVLTGNVIPRTGLAKGNLGELVLRNGPESLVFPPTSGNAWRRSFLQAVLPIPEQGYRLCPDSYLLALSAVSGPLGCIDEPQALYRVHGKNHSLGDSFDQVADGVSPRQDGL